jgi:hypothetical protein
MRALEPDPSRIVTVTDLSPETLQNIIELLEISTDFEHLVYREAELDAIWSLSGFLLKEHPGEAPARLHEIAHAAHDLVADQRPKEAAALLRSFL